MSDGFAEMIQTANTFFTKLKSNNTKEWFAGQKDFYTAEIKKPAELFANLLAEDLARLTGKAHKPKLFRIHRDVRFSKDKTPYNAHLHIIWTPAKEGAPAWFFGSSPEYLSLFTGVMGLKGERLTTYRAFIDREGDALTDAMADAAAKAGTTLSEWGDAPLKRIPKPYAENHPHADLLKRKNLILQAPPARNWKTEGLIGATLESAEALLPVWKLMDKHLG